MSAHFPFAPRGGGPRHSSITLFLASTPLPHLERLLLVTIGDTARRSRPWMASQARMGQLFGVSARHIRRAVKHLADQRLIRVVRRGRTMTNLIYLAAWLWEKLTGHKVRWPIHRGRQMPLNLWLQQDGPLQGALRSLWRKAGLKPEEGVA